MKKIILKFATLIVLTTAGFLLNNSSPVQATSCWETVYNTWSNCDNNYSNTIYQASNASYYCSTNSASNCAAIADNSCSAQANSSCINSSTPQTCYNNAYNSCYSSSYSSCYNSTHTECLQNAQNAYDNRGSAYASCIGIEGNGNNCIEQMDTCDIARDRASACVSMYSNTEDADAYSECRANSGIDMCQ